MKKLLPTFALAVLVALPVTPAWSQSGESRAENPGDNAALSDGDRDDFLVPDRKLVDRWAATLTSEDEGTARAARERLAAGRQDSFSIIVALLRHEVISVRRASVDIASQRLDLEALLPHLIPLLRDPDLGIRWAAARSLGRRGAACAAAAPELVQSMLDPALRNQTASMWAIAALGEAAWPALIETLREPSTILASRAFDMISGPGVQVQGGDECATGALRQALSKHPDAAVRRQAARVMRRLKLLGPEEETALLKAALDDEAAEVRIAAAEALVETPADRHADLVRSLREGRHDPDLKARAAIVEALKKLGAGEEDLK